jgi:DNA-binding transcriptional LysR family regulator
MYNAVTIEAFRALDAIDKKGSFSAAAKSLYKVPSALTYTIKKLEDDIGVPLFDRTKQRAQLTPAGKLVLEQGRDILLATNRLLDSVKQLESGWESEIRIARDTVIPQDYLFDLIADFNQIDQNVNVSLSVEVLGGGWDALHSGRADIVIGATGELPKGLFHTHKMGEVTFVFAISPQHPLADVEGKIEQEQLSDYPAIVVADTSQILPEQNSGRFTSKQVILVSDIESKIAAQIRGLGTGFIPAHLAKPYLQSGQLIEKECDFPRPGQEVYIAWHKEQEGKAFEWFVDQLCKVNWPL